MARHISPNKLRALRNELIEFHNLYGNYIDLTWPPEEGGLSSRAAELRAELLSRVAKAQRAVSQSGVHLVLTPPPAFGGPVLHGLSNLLFVHETIRGYTGMGSAPFFEDVREALRIAEGYLAQQEEEACRLWRNPLYWLDRLLTTLLGFPAYILSRILGVPVARIDESPAGVALRLLAVCLDGLAVYFGGRALMWW